MRIKVKRLREVAFRRRQSCMKMKHPSQYLLLLDKVAWSRGRCSARHTIVGRVHSVLYRRPADGRIRHSKDAKDACTQVNASSTGIQAQHENKRLICERARDSLPTCAIRFGRRISSMFQDDYLQAKLFYTTQMRVEEDLDQSYLRVIQMIAIFTKLAIILILRLYGQ